MRLRILEFCLHVHADALKLESELVNGLRVTVLVGIFEPVRPATTLKELDQRIAKFGSLTHARQIGQKPVQPDVVGLIAPNERPAFEKHKIRRRITENPQKKTKPLRIVFFGHGGADSTLATISAQCREYSLYFDICQTSDSMRVPDHALWD